MGIKEFIRGHLTGSKDKRNQPKTDFNPSNFMQEPKIPPGYQLFQDEGGIYYFRDAIDENGFFITDPDGYVVQDKVYLPNEQ